MSADRSPADRAQIDPRGPRFGAGMTAVLLLVDLFLALTGTGAAATVLLAAICVVFAWGAFAGIERHPYGRLFRAVVRPSLQPPAELEEAAPRRSPRAWAS